MYSHSEVSIVSESLDGWSIICEWLVDVTFKYISSSVLLKAVLVSFGKNFLSGDNVFLHHLAEEDVIDFNIMCRKSVMQETWREHHVVSIVPEGDSVLGVECLLISSSLESDS